MNGAYETTTTSGTGTVTLSAVTGRPRFSDAGVGALVPYAIKDGNNWEWGIGKVSASNTLARTKVTATLVSGTYDNTSPTAITLSGSAADVYLSPISGAHPVSLRRLATDSSRKGLYSPHIATPPSGTLTLAAERLYLFPFRLDDDFTLTGAFIDMNTAGAASTKARIGIYRMDENGQPAEVLAETGDIDTSVAAAVLSGTWTDINLPPDWYFIGLVCSGTPTVVAHPSSSAVLQTPLGIDGAAGSCLPIIGYFKTIGAGWSALPASPTSLSKFYYNTSAFPAIALKVA
jgi:hypothetical protein